MKPWREDIKHHIEHWSSQLGNRGWWPRFVYHFTDVNNAARIIRAGCLYSRSECINRNLMVVDNASSEIIQHTRTEHLDYVRLYFRPRTPTQFHNEGIRPVNHRAFGAHCPIPIFFCFDALDILSKDETEFSNGNMASGAVQYSKDCEFFHQIPFQYVFHDGRFTSDFRDIIIFHRHAEVLVPKKLPLFPSLKFIACRTAAERQTLLHLLPLNLRRTWSTRIRIADLDLFERRWTFVEEVVVVNDIITFRFNPSTKGPGPFHARITYRENGSTDINQWEGKSPALDGSWRVRIPQSSSGEVCLYLDNALAFADTIIFDDLPF